MRPLNRPMFKNGGPIKEGIMQGMKEPQAINTVGSPLAPQDETGRGGYALPLLAFAPAAAATAARFLAPRAIMGGLRALKTGFQSTRMTSPFDKGITKMQRLRNILPTGRFLEFGKKIPLGGKNPRNLPVPFGATMDATGKMTLRQAFTNPRIIGKAIRENPGTAFLAAGQIKNTPEYLSGAYDIGKGTLQGGANYLLGTEFGKNTPKETEKTDLKRVNKIGDTSATTGTTKPGEASGATVVSDAEKTKLEEDRIASTKEKYYKLMGVDKLNKQATYDTLIGASQKIREGGNIKDQIKSGSLVSGVIESLSKNLDKSVDLKKQIDAAILKGEIEKDINLTKPSAFQEQLAYIRANPNDPLAKKLSGQTSVADIVSAAVASGKGTTLTSDNIVNFIESKGYSSTALADDKYQKWAKSNENKDEVDYFIEKYSGADDGLYVVNKKAFIKRGNEIAPVSLDSLVG